MRGVVTLLFLGLAFKALPQVIQAEYFFDNASVAYGQGTSLAVPSNTGSVNITAELPVSGLPAGFHQVFFRIRDAAAGWSTLTPVTFIKMYHEVFAGYSYGFDIQTDLHSWTYHSFSSPSATISDDVEIPLTNITPGFHQVILRAKDSMGEWSPITPKTFLNLNPHENIVGYSYHFDDGIENWIYKTIASPSADITQVVELDLGTLTKGTHYVEIKARTERGEWTPVSGGTFFNVYAEPLNITSLEYYFEDESGVAGSLLTVNDFTASPHVTLDSVTFAVPAGTLTHLKKYFVYMRAVDEAGNRSFYIKDTLVYHKSTTGIKDQICLTPSLMVFPNPADDMINLKFVPLDYPGDFIIKIYDTAGKMVAMKRFSFSEADHYIIDISELASGVYRIAINTTAGKPSARATFMKK